MKADAPSLSRGRLFATATGMDALRESLRRDPPRRILIVTRTHTGDAVMSTGAVEAIVRRFSGAEIVLETTRRACGVFDNVPGIHARRCRSERFEKLASTVWLRASRPFDLVVLLDDSRRRAKVARWGGARQVVGVREADGEPWLSASVRWDAHGHDLFDSLLGVLALLDAGADIRPRLYIDEAARASADRVLAPLSGARAAGVFVDAAVEQKRWPLDRFVELAARLERSGVPTLATAGIGGHRRLEPFRRAGLRTAEPAERPLALAALFERLQLLVTND
ncbi:MAG TPA: hypothetical protein VEU08_04820, partial [Vicinamibacterales bacterium]|nr:hypothetical protein [Vicinamibacterales bacterium]